MRDSGSDIFFVVLIWIVLIMFAALIGQARREIIDLRQRVERLEAR